MKPTFRTCTLLCLGLLLALSTVPVRSQTPATTLTLTSLDAAAFPQIALHMLAWNPDGRPRTDLEADAFSVTEDETPVTLLVERKNFGARYAFVLDIGTGVMASGASGKTRWKEMQGTLELLLGTPWMQNPSCTGMLIVQDPEGTRPLAGAGSDASQLLTAYRQYQPKEFTGLSKGLQGISAALEQFAADTAGFGQFRGIVFLTTGLQYATTRDVELAADQARVAGIPIYPILFRQEEDIFALPLRTLAADSGGFYSIYDAQGMDGLLDLTSLLSSVREQYQLLYRSTNAESGRRVVVVEVQGGGESVPVVTRYEVTIAPPRVQITAPQAGEPLLVSMMEPAAGEGQGEGTLTATPVSGYRVDGKVDWTDSHPRQIRLAELLINGQAVLAVENPPALEFYLPPEKVPAFAQGNVALKIRITDELGLKAESESVAVNLSASALGSLCATGPDIFKSIFCSGSQWIFWILLVASIVGLVLFFVYRKKLFPAGAAGSGEESAEEPEPEETFRFRAGATGPRAYLVVLGEPGPARQSPIELFGTATIGRSPKAATVAVHRDNPKSPISRLHATILEEDGEFFLRDEQSANGTFLNGSRLVPLERNTLKEGDEIELGKAREGGLKMRFQRIKPEGGS